MSSTNDRTRADATPRLGTQGSAAVCVGLNHRFTGPQGELRRARGRSDA